MNNISLLNKFQTVSLEEISSVKLMNRTDTKFIFNANKLDAVLEKAVENYKIVKINNTRIPTYKTLYFDTDDFKMYKAHHQGKRNRYKVRHREYVESGVNFFEIKFKSNKGKTIKKRIRQAEIRESFSAESEMFLENNTPFAPEMLKAKVYNEFSRITLINKLQKERITIDTGLEFRDFFNKVSLDALVITEVKREGLSKSSEFINILKSEKIYPAKFSKYCTGTAILNKDLKHNRFKPRFLQINKTIKHNDNFKHIFK